MGRVSQDTIDKLNAFIDSLPEMIRSKCALCSETLTHVVKKAEVETGAGTATVTRVLAGKMREDVAAGLYTFRCRTGGGQANIYVASIQLYPGLVKIGCTSGDVFSRLRTLSGQMLHSFELIEYYSLPASAPLKKVESEIFKALSEYRVRIDREWFYISCLEFLREILEPVEGIERVI